MDQHESDPGRHLRLSDTMALIAAVSLMLSTGRFIQWFWAWGDPIASYGPRQIQRMAWSLALVESSLILLSLAMARRMGRDRLRKGAAGLHVHVAIVTVLVLRLVGWTTEDLVARVSGGSPLRWTVVVMNYLYDDIRRDMAIAVAASWTALAIAGRWQAEKSWDDRLGRILGLLWIALYLCASWLLRFP